VGVGDEIHIYNQADSFGLIDGVNCCILHIGHIISQDVYFFLEFDRKREFDRNTS
jgi:hypothetical protein